MSSKLDHIVPANPSSPVKPRIAIILGLVLAVAVLSVVGITLILVRQLHQRRKERAVAAPPPFTLGRRSRGDSVAGPLGADTSVKIALPSPEPVSPAHAARHGHRVPVTASSVAGGASLGGSRDPSEKMMSEIKHACGPPDTPSAQIAPQAVLHRSPSSTSTIPSIKVDDSLPSPPELLHH
ncbi:hypothetical protein FRB99_008323 [Tulasnella sp. 403]|nr:hypothetical protein FRB99_008323 [Tulasnella sp. 403]